MFGFGELVYSAKYVDTLMPCKGVGAGTSTRVHID